MPEFGGQWPETAPSVGLVRRCDRLRRGVRGWSEVDAVAVESQERTEPGSRWCARLGPGCRRGPVPGEPDSVTTRRTGAVGEECVWTSVDSVSSSQSRGHPRGSLVHTTDGFVSMTSRCYATTNWPSGQPGRHRHRARGPLVRIDDPTPPSHPGRPRCWEASAGAALIVPVVEKELGSTWRAGAGNA